MNLQQYRRLTNQLSSAIRNVETCSTERERLYTLSLLRQCSCEACVSYCNDASADVIESMDLALKSGLEMIETHSGNNCLEHCHPDYQTNTHLSYQALLKKSLHQPVSNNY